MAEIGFGYRELAVVEKEPEVQCGRVKSIDTGGGYYKRVVPCPKPGWWSRLWNTCRYGEIWQCGDCGSRYRYTYSGWERET